MDEEKSIILHLNVDFVTEMKKVLLDPSFPFTNFKLFTEIGIYELYLNFLQVKNNQKDLEEFNSRMRTHSQNLVKRNWIKKNVYGWKEKK